MLCRTCFDEIQVILNQTTLDFVCESLPDHDDGSIATTFDAWMNASILHTTADYNMA